MTWSNFVIEKILNSNTNFLDAPASQFFKWFGGLGLYMTIKPDIFWSDSKCQASDGRATGPLIFTCTVFRHTREILKSINRFAGVTSLDQHGRFFMNPY